MTVLNYEASCGEHIKEAIKGALKMSSSKGLDVEFDFNGITLRVNAINDSPDSILAMWNQKNDERSKKYRESEDFKELEKTRKIELDENQLKIDKLMSLFPKNDHYKIIVWLKDFSVYADYIGVTYDKELVLSKLKSFGFKSNDLVGYKGEWSSEQLVQYTVGQVINCMEKFGSPHPITSKFCDDILKRDDFRAEEVLF